MVVQSDNGPNAKPVTVKDLITLCKSLNATGVKYMVIGGFAVNHYGFARMTVDIDILVETGEENISKIKQALKYLPEKAAEDIAPGDVGKYQVVRVSDEIIIDLMAKVCAITYKTAEVKYFQYDDVTIPIATLPTLIETKKFSVRPKDKEDLRYLNEIEKEKYKGRE